MHLHVPIGNKPLMLMLFILKTAFITELWLHGLLCGKWALNYIMLELTASAHCEYLSHSGTGRHKTLSGQMLLPAFVQCWASMLMTLDTPSLLLKQPQTLTLCLCKFCPFTASHHSVLLVCALVVEWWWFTDFTLKVSSTHVLNFCCVWLFQCLLACGLSPLLSICLVLAGH